MKIQLKSIKINNAFSEETTCFTADIFVNGKKVGYARNDGRGGCTDYNAYPDKVAELNKAEKYALSLPKIKITETLSIESNLEYVIDDLLTEHLKSLEDKKMNKIMEYSIVFGKPNGISYRYIGLKFIAGKLSEVIKYPIGKASVIKLIDKAKSELKEGEEIFNKELLKELGL